MVFATAFVDRTYLLGILQQFNFAEMWNGRKYRSRNVDFTHMEMEEDPIAIFRKFLTFCRRFSI